MKQKFVMPEGEIVEKDMPVWKTPWNHDTEFESARTATFTPEPSLTKQEFKEETDINVILARFMRTGEPPPMVLPEHFADLTTKTTYFDMARGIAEANKHFYLLDASKRAEFQNDPTRWADAVVAAVGNNDREALADLGIDVPKEKPQEAQTGNPPQGGTPAPAPPQKAPEASKTGETPDPKTDKGK